MQYSLNFLVKAFCWLKIKIIQFSSGFHVKLYANLRNGSLNIKHFKFYANWTCRYGSLNLLFLKVRGAHLTLLKLCLLVICDKLLLTISDTYTVFLFIFFWMYLYTKLVQGDQGLCKAEDLELVRFIFLL